MKFEIYCTEREYRIRADELPIVEYFTGVGRHRFRVDWAKVVTYADEPGQVLVVAGGPIILRNGSQNRAGRRGHTSWSVGGRHASKNAPEWVLKLASA